MHAEMNALRRARPGDKLFVLRVRTNGKLALAKPCATCQAKLRKAKVKVWYTDNDGEWQRLLFE